jgi:hypothetical protein
MEGGDSFFTITFFLIQVSGISIQKTGMSHLPVQEVIFVGKNWGFGNMENRHFLAVFSLLLADQNVDNGTISNTRSLR